MSLLELPPLGWAIVWGVALVSLAFNALYIWACWVEKEGVFSIDPSPKTPVPQSPRKNGADWALVVVGAFGLVLYLRWGLGI